MPNLQKTLALSCTVQAKFIGHLLATAGMFLASQSAFGKTQESLTYFGYGVATGIAKKLYSRLTTPTQEAELCTICHEPYPNSKEDITAHFVVKKLTCKHVYHKNCIDRWLTENPTCPTCRAPHY